MRRGTIASAITDSGLSGFSPGNTKSPLRKSCSALTVLSARRDNGTRGSRPAPAVSMAPVLRYRRHYPSIQPIDLPRHSASIHALARALAFRLDSRTARDNGRQTAEKSIIHRHFQGWWRTVTDGHGC